MHELWELNHVRWGFKATQGEINAWIMGVKSIREGWI